MQPIPGAANSIRWRILKDYSAISLKRRAGRCSELDPMEDTERAIKAALQMIAEQGAANSIRWRILKALTARGLRAADPGCSELDPMEDTESFPGCLSFDGLGREVQRTRSDGGY